jgi:hypothetical protein
MRTLPTLGVCGWLVAAAALSALSALEWISGGVAQAQQFDPPVSSGQNLLQLPPFDLFQKEPFFLGYEGLDRRYESLGGGLERLTPPACPPRADDWLSSCWLSTVSDFVFSYSPSSARESQSRQQLLFFSVGSSRGKGDYWKPGEFDRLIGR